MMPAIVFRQGFHPKGTNTDLLDHASRNGANSIYVATSRSMRIAFEFAGKNGFVYKILSDRGIDVNLALGAASPFPEQLEVAIPGGIFPNEIVGAYPKRGGLYTGEFIRNPFFTGR